jgi:hypothetical protein
VSDAENKNKQPIIFDLTDEPIVADAIFPELPEPSTMQGLPDATRVVQFCQAFLKELKDAIFLLWVELA